MVPKSWIAAVVHACFLCCCVSAKRLWSSQPASFNDIIKTAFPIGNGQLAALPFGKPGHEKFSLNRDSLWSGGPFENASYDGGNPSAPVASALPGIRDRIFRNGTGNVSALMGSDDNYGSYYVLGNLSVSIQSVSNATNYKRSLDLHTGIHTTTFHTANASFTSQVFCSCPDSVCVYRIASTVQLPPVDIVFTNEQANASLVRASCSHSTQSARFRGTTQADIGMVYAAEARVIGSTGNITCHNETGTLHVVPSSQSLTLVIAAGTDYDETKGTPATDYSFKGLDPTAYVASTAASAAAQAFPRLMNKHVSDFTSLSSKFSLELPDPLRSAGKETADLIAAYNQTEGPHSDPYLESLQFEYGRYLFISSSRDKSLPPNLQGKWAYGIGNAWGADYHANINIQMNHWGIDATGLGDLQKALWTYMNETWAPRGSETARLLYDAPGWVTHDEMNIFGHTGMKTGDEYWANYPASAAWMMLHVADHYDYSQDVNWLGEVGYPMLKAISQFWLSQLQKDRYFHDGSLVVNPCSSPEHGLTTFGCTHYQQLLHSLFINTLSAATKLADTDDDLTSSLKSTLTTLDKGFHIGTWGQVQEWKIDMDVQNDTHRHLSHLIGWYPGSSLSSYLNGYSTGYGSNNDTTNTTSVASAVHTSLLSRGPGIADANAGWEKVWRAACWARLNDSLSAYGELQLTLAQNMAPNLLSMYSGHNEPFQIDANFGFVGAILSMLVVDLPEPHGFVGTRVVVMGPAIPTAWGGGSVKGLRLRGGGEVDFEWDADGIVTSARWAKASRQAVTVVNVRDEVLL
ncbi:hypothetical protein AAFC00_006707 [Neodothiora populina]